MQIPAPTQQPAPGVTIPIAQAQLLKQCILVRTRCGHSMTIVPINAFPRWGEYRRDTQIAINRLLSRHQSLGVTIPTPISRHHPNWTKQLSSTSPKPGWIWLSGTETINEYLRHMPDVTTTPPANQTRLPILKVEPPIIRPSHQITMACRVMRCDSQDVVRVMGSDDHEMPIALLDCYEREQLAREQLGRVRERIIHEHCAGYTIPLPDHLLISDWLEQLAESRCMAGWLWMRQARTVNEYLVSRGLATHGPQ